jgi:hypothetical protein
LTFDIIRKISAAELSKNILIAFYSSLDSIVAKNSRGGESKKMQPATQERRAAYYTTTTYFISMSFLMEVNGFEPSTG